MKGRQWPDYTKSKRKPNNKVDHERNGRVIFLKVTCNFVDIEINYHHRKKRHL